MSIDNLSAPKLTYLIELLAIPGQSLSEIKDKYEKFFRETANGEIILLVKGTYSKEIAEKRESYLSSIGDNPLSHRKIRLDIYNRIVEAAMEPHETWQKVDKEWKSVVKQDLPSALRGLDSARQEMFEWEKIEISKQKANSPSGSVSVPPSNQNVGIVKFPEPRIVSKKDHE